ncbi:MAG TPA: helix-turn-helix domain-containing protein [Trebonia sp.]
MLDSKQEGTLAETHVGKPGLPRGRNRLPAPDVQASQRERLLRAAIAAVAQKGYPAVTVADIVRRAKVSRAAFYLHFRSREDCFMAATRQGGQLLLEHVAEAARAVPADAPDEESLRAGCRAFLRFLADEPAFARVFYIDMPAAGPATVQRLKAAGARYAEVNAKWHRRARIRHPDWPTVPEEAYQALAGATLELVRSRVSADKTESLPDLEDIVVALHLAVLAAQPWPAARDLASPGPGRPGPQPDRSYPGRARSPFSMSRAAR